MPILLSSERAVAPSRTRRSISASIAIALGVALAVGSVQSANAAAPNAPAQLSPVSGTTGTTLSPTLSASYSDPEGDAGGVSFYGRKVGATVPLVTPQPDYTLVVIPDTQNYTGGGREGYMNEQMQWIVDHRSSLNIAFTAGLGDLVGQFDLPSQWQKTSNAYAILDNAGIPYSVVPGNHDFDNATGDGTPYNTYFPPTRLAGDSWNNATTHYGGYLGQNLFGPDPIDRGNMDNFTLFTAGGIDYISLALEWEAPQYAVDWAQKVINAYPNRKIIMSMHSFINTQSGRATIPERKLSGGKSPQQLWDQLVYPNCSIVMVVNGHYHDGDAGEGSRFDTNSCGVAVPQLLSDYQSRANGGNGWLRYYTFKPSQNLVQAVTYSPHLDQFETDVDSSFTFPMALTPTQPAPFTLIGTAAATDGGTASVTWNGLAEGTSYEWYAVASDGQSSGASATSTFTTGLSTVLATDTFGRSVTSGWGSATTGGPWTPAGTASRYGVGAGVGTMTLTSGNSSTEATLASVQSTSTVLQADVSLDRASGTGGLNIFATPRRIDGRNAYIAKLFVSATNTLRLSLTARVNNVETNIGPSLVLPASVNYAAGKKFTIKTVADGVWPTTFKVKVWATGASEPDWQLVATDSTAALQAPGAVSFSNYLTPSSLLAPVTLSVDNVLATRVGATPPPANIPPVARIGTPVITGATVAVSGSTSTDSDGTVTSYSWAFGDGSTATGVTASHPYSSSGTYPVVLTVTDNSGATATATTSVTVTVPPPANTPPIARIAAPVITGRSVVFSGLTSTDADGTVTGYLWNFGDGTTATSGTTTHLYAADGTFPVTLTVTDDAAATGTATTSVTVSTSASLDLARDTFARTVAGGWGQADLGGAWSVAGTASRYSVGGGVGSMPALAPGGSGEAWLGSVSSTSTDLRADMTFNRSASGGTYYAYVEQRRVDAKNNYETTFQVGSNGKIGLSISSTVNGTAVAIGRATLPASYVYTAGQTYLIAVQAVGTNPTVLKAKTWLAGSTEPDWQIAVQDSSAALQKAGAIGVSTYQSGSSTLTDWRLTVDNLVAVKLG